MTEQLWWMVGIVAVILAAAVGFLLGRRGQGDRLRLAELEETVERQKEEIAGYKREVESHFDRTAALFTSMAGNYRELFDHLSSGYEKLSGGSARDLFRQRVDAVLLEGGATVAEEAPEATPAEGDATATPAADSAADVAATTDAAAEGRVDPVAAAMAESAEAEQTGATGAAATDLVEDATTEVTDSGGDGTGKTEGDVKAEGAAAPAAADEPPKTARSDR
ncbi:MAG: YhcB family protein [Rhodocyclaceae bacterium]|nr:YhcB family protein [Rhodocyclaceae bacterium]